MPSLSDTIASNVRILGQSAVAVTAAADTSENILATITIPANTIGANGRIVVDTIWGFTNSANTKTPRIRLGGISGTAYGAVNITTSESTRLSITILNRNSASSQVGGPSGTSFGSSVNPAPTSSIDTAQDTTIVITAQKASAGELARLEAYSVTVFPRA